MMTQNPSPAGENVAAPASRLKVFISYSRADAGFADEITAGLEFDGGFEVFVDRQDIQEGEDWRARLGSLISSADLVVFLLSPHSAVSEICSWEVEHALALSKRIVPALVEPVKTKAVPSAVAALNYVRFDEGRSFMNGLAALCRTLRVDLDWIREHTRLLVRAQEWEAAGRSDNRLLSGEDILNAKSWLANRSPDVPAPLELHRDFIAASDGAQAIRLSEERKRAEDLQVAVNRTRRALIAVVALLVAASVTIVFAILQWTRANNAAESARLALAEAERERLLQARMLKLANNRNEPEPPYTYDILSRRYEGQSSDHVGSDFSGNYYYGVYRINGGANMQEFIGFLKKHRRHFPHPYYRILTEAGGDDAARKKSDVFVKAWRSLALDPETQAGFSDVQRDFIHEFDYKRLRNRLEEPPPSGLGLDVTSRSKALQAVIFSIAVQYGPRTTLPFDALQGVDDLGTMDDREMIQKLYDRRNDVSAYFEDIKRSNFIELIKQRNEWEKQDALFILEHEKQ